MGTAPPRVGHRISTVAEAEAAAAPPSPHGIAVGRARSYEKEMNRFARAHPNACLARAARGLVRRIG